MSKRPLAKWIKYLVATLVGLIVGVIYLVSYDFLGQSATERLRLVCDAFFLPGALMIMAATMMWLSNEGSFDGIAFVCGRAFRMLIPGAGRGKGETYKEYVERRRGKKRTGFAFLFIVGIGFCLAATVFMLLFLRAKGLM